ncbi:MAG: dephospho-CoA kinase, partial [Pedobacter sp.]|nr:dephospho-CoA kinase [Chitinophagaceae bacterium]
MKKIGLTGGIGSGKSVVAGVFKTLGIPVFDADSAAKKLMEEDAELISAIKASFGEKSYFNGQLNRKYIADIVFNDAYQLALLNSLTHPATIKAFEVWASQQDAPYIIKEAALLFEAGTASNLNFIIGVTAPQAMRIQRVMQRDGITREDVLNRMDKQIGDSIKMRLCDAVIINDEQQFVIEQVLVLHEKFIPLTPKGEY